MERLSRESNKLYQAIKTRSWSEVKNICKSDPKLINTVDELGESVLMRAVWLYKSPEDIILLLLENATQEAIEYERPVLERTLLHCLAKRGYTASVRYLLENTSKHINAADSDGQTALHECLASSCNYEQHRETALCLMTYGASCSVRDNEGRTPIGLYSNNKCNKYDKTTKKFNKKRLINLIEEFSVPAEILARGEDAVRVFKDELLNGEVTIVNSRVMFLGMWRSGKTNCVNAIFGKGFNPNEDSTVGIVTTETVFQIDDGCCKWKERDIDVIHLSNEIRVHALVENVAKRLAERKKSTELNSNEEDPENISKRSSTSSDNLEEELLERKVNETDYCTTEKVSVGPLGKKFPEKEHRLLVDMINSNLSSEHTNDAPAGLLNKVQRFIKRKPVNFSRSNSVPREITSVWDFAGQLEYFITHRFFLTDGVSYCVVFKATDDLNDYVQLSTTPSSLEEHFVSYCGSLGMTYLEMIVFWIRSIYEFAIRPALRTQRKKLLLCGKTVSPPIFLVATYMDNLTGNESNKKSQIETMRRRIFDTIEDMPYKEHVIDEIYMVDHKSKSNEGIEKLKKNLGKYMKAMKRTIPIKWVDFLTKVQEVGKTSIRKSLKEITKIGVECGISEEHIINALHYLHDTGIILYNGHNEKLKNTVITNVHSMMDMVVRIFTDREPKDIEKYSELDELWKSLNSTGTLDEKLLRHLWRSDIETDASRFDVFVEILKQYGLIFEKEVQEGGRSFLVPSRLKLESKPLKVVKDREDTVSLYISTVKAFLPDAIYHTLIIGFLTLLKEHGRRNATLYKNCSIFDFKDHNISLGSVELEHQKENRNALKLEILRKEVVYDGVGREPVHEPPNSSFCVMILEYMQNQLKTYGSSENITYKLRVLCTACKPKPEPHLHSFKECMEANVPCGGKEVCMQRLKTIFSTCSTVSTVSSIYAHTSSKAKTQTDDNFQQMLVDVSEWFDEYQETPDRLKVLYKDIITPYSALQSANSTMDLFKLLKCSGNLNLNNYKVLIDTIKVTDTLGVLNVNELLRNCNTELDVTSFTNYRQKLFQFGNALSQENHQRLVDLKCVPHSQNNNQWSVILYLEQRGIISESNMGAFVQDLQINEMIREAEILE